jgi:hypothetical protein
MRRSLRQRAVEDERDQLRCASFFALAVMWSDTERLRPNSFDERSP